MPSKSKTLPPVTIAIAVIVQIIVIIVVHQVKHLIITQTILVILSQWLRYISGLYPCFERIQIFLRVGNVVEVKHVAVGFRMTNFNANSAP